MPEILNLGDRVECDDDFFLDQSDQPFKSNQINLPVAERCYTIREITWTNHGMGIRLTEIVNRTYWFADIRAYREPTFNPTRFHLVPNA